jgi:outer membrane protein
MSMPPVFRLASTNAGNKKTDPSVGFAIRSQRLKQPSTSRCSMRPHVLFARNVLSHHLRTLPTMPRKVNWKLFFRSNLFPHRGSYMGKGSVSLPEQFPFGPDSLEGSGFGMLGSEPGRRITRDGGLSQPGFCGIQDAVASRQGRFCVRTKKGRHRMSLTPVTTRIAILTAAALAAAAGDAPGVTLNECIAAALSGNPDVRSATERVEAASAAIQEAASAWYPMLGGSATYARTDNAPQAFMMMLNQRRVSMQSDFNHPPDTENLALSLGLKYRLYDFGRRELDRRMAQDGADISRLVLEGLQNDLIHQVTRGYYAVLQASAFVAVQEESIGTLQESLRIANERLKAGQAVRSDVLNLEVQLAQANEDLIRARNRVKLAVAALNTAIGNDLVDAGMAAEANPPAAVSTNLPPRPPPREDPGAIRGRPELQAARRVAELQQAGLAKARRQYLPTVNVFGSLDWNSDVSSDFERSYVAGVAAEVDIFDGFRRRAAVTGAGAQQRAAQADVDRAAGNLRLDLTSASIQAGEAWDRLDVVRKSIVSAEEALRITRERYQQGAADLPELLTTQVGLTGTRTRHVSALYDYLTALSNLDRAKGELIRRFVRGNPERR